MAEKKHRTPLFFLLKLLCFNFVCRPDFVSYDHKQYKNGAFRLCRSLFRVTSFAWTVRSLEEEKAAYSHKFNTVIFENYLPGEENNEI